MKEVELTFIPHCDDGSCDLGCVEFECPFCEKLNRDYGELWFHFATENKIEADCSCEKCKRKMTIVKLPDEDGIYWSTYYLKDDGQSHL